MVSSTKTLKCFALTWDVIYAILSLAVIGIGAFILYKFDSFSSYGIGLISLWAVVLLIAIFGIVGAARESSHLLKIFAIFAVILAIVHVLVVAFFWAFKTSFLIIADKAFDEVWREQPTPIKPGNGSHIAPIERWLDCCGNTGPKDYILPPYSCYEAKTDRLSLEGCRQKFVDFFSDSWMYLNIFVLIFVLAELICATFSYVLANSIVNRWRRSKYYPK